MRCKVRTGEFRLGATAADLVIRTGKHRLKYFRSFVGLHNQPSATSVHVSALPSKDRNEIAFRVRSSTPETPLSGAILGGNDEQDVEVGFLERHKDFPFHITGKWRLADYHIAIRDVAGRPLPFDEDTAARIEIIRTLIKKNNEKSSNFLNLDLSPFLEAPND